MNIDHRLVALALRLDSLPLITSIHLDSPRLTQAPASNASTSASGPEPRLAVRTEAVASRRRRKMVLPRGLLPAADGAEPGQVRLKRRCVARSDHGVGVEPGQVTAPLLSQVTERALLLVATGEWAS